MGNLIVDLMVENGFLEKDIKKLNELVKELEIQNKEVAKENKELKASVDYLQQLKKENKIEIEYLKGHINDQIDYVLNDEILELKNKNEKQAKLLGTLKGKLDAHRRNSRKLQRELEQEVQENKNLSEQNGQLIHSYNRMKNELERANRERAKELQENSVLSNVINTYESSTNSLNYKIKQLTEELNKLKSKEYINDKWGRYENTINDLKRKINEYEVREKDYQRDLEQLNKLYCERRELCEMNTDKHNEIIFLKAKLNNALKELEKLHTRKKELKKIIDKKNNSLVHFMNKTKENGELSIKMTELLNRYLRCATEPTFYLSLEKEIQFNEHLLSTVLFLQQAHLISDRDYCYYTEKITNSLNKLKEGIDNEKR